MTAGPGAVVVEGLSKCYALYEQPWHRLADWLSGGRSRYRQEIWPLREVSFRVRRGESVGIIGLNGAGRTTLLKLALNSWHHFSRRWRKSFQTGYATAW